MALEKVSVAINIAPADVTGRPTQSAGYIVLLAYIVTGTEEVIFCLGLLVGWCVGLLT